jgi:glycosyltransferase involved in cell wall biosynthesis
MMLKPKTKIQLFCINFPPEKTGIAPYTGGLATGLVKSGYEVIVVTTQPHYPSWVIEPGYKKWFSKTNTPSSRVERVLHFVPSKSVSISRLISEITFGVRAVIRIRPSADCAVLLSPALFSSSIIMFVLKLLDKRKPVIVWVQDLYAVGLLEMGRGSSLPYKITLKVEKWLLSKADKVVVIHERFSTKLVGQYGVDLKRISVISNWSHVQASSSFDRNLERKKYGWTEDEIVVLHTGNMGLKQGLLNVVDSARIADSIDRNIKFVLCGDGSERAYLEEKAEGIEKIQFLKPVDDEAYTRLLKCSDILLVNELLGIHEMSVPSKLTSYFKAGRPILGAVSQGGSTSSEIIKSGAGIVISSGSPDLLLSEALKMFDDEKLMKKLAEKGEEYAATFLAETEAISKFVTEIKKHS